MSGAEPETPGAAGPGGAGDTEQPTGTAEAGAPGPERSAADTSGPPAARLATGFQWPDPALTTEFWVVRHGESTWNALGRYQGQSDVPLSGEGRLQAAMLAERLTGLDFTAVYSSDLARALNTAQIVTERLAGPPPVQTDLGLREIDVGLLSGLDTPQMKRQYAAYLDALRADPWATRRPGGESMEDLYARAGASFQAMRERHPGGRVLVFTHGGVVRVAVGLALGGVPQNAWARLSVTNTSVTRVMLTPTGGTLLGFNDAAHLEALTEAAEADDVLGPSQEA